MTELDKPQESHLVWDMGAGDTTVESVLMPKEEYNRLKEELAEAKKKLEEPLDSTKMLAESRTQCALYKEELAEAKKEMKESDEAADHWTKEAEECIEIYGKIMGENKELKKARAIARDALQWYAADKHISSTRSGERARKALAELRELEA